MGIICLSHNSFCDIVFCNLRENNVRNRNLRARVIYAFTFFLVTFFMTVFRDYLQIYLEIVLSSFVCSADLQILTCFQVNLLLRISGALFVYHLVLAILSFSRDDISILVNESFWVLKFMAFISIVFFNMFVPLSVWVVYGVFAKLISVVMLALQIIILNDSILIVCETHLVPFFKSGKCGKITMIIIGYIIPISVNITIFAYNFVVYTPICSPYLIINTMILLLIAMLIVINLMRLSNITGPVIASLWFTLFIGVLNNSILSSTPHSACEVADSDGNYSTSASSTNVVIDSVLSFTLLAVTLIFLCVVTKRDAKKYSYYAESWFYYFVLREVGNSYMKYNPKLPIRKRKYRRPDSQDSSFNKNGTSVSQMRELMGDIVEKDVVRKLAVGNYKIPDDFDPKRVRFRSRQAFFFNLIMAGLGIYTAVIFTSWIHVTVDDIETGTEVYDNTSIWARFIGIVFGIMFSAVKVFRAHYHYSRLQLDEDYAIYEDDQGQ